MGITFYYMFADEAVGQFLRSDPDAYIKVKAGIERHGLSRHAWETGWMSFESYLKAFPNPVLQNALFGMLMHWDWYISKLGKFVQFGRVHVLCPPLGRKEIRQLGAIGRIPLREQFGLLQAATGVSPNLPIATIESLVEMNLVRNLGMHNQWEVDEHYKQRARSGDWLVGSIRAVSWDEIREWQANLSDAVRATAILIAQKFVEAPEYTLSS